MRKFVLSLVCIVISSISFAQEIATQKEDVFKGINNIVVNADFCALKIRGHEANEVSFKGAIKAEENKEAYSFKVSEQEGNLTIVVTKPSQWKSHWGEIILNVPQGVSMEVTSQSGKVDVAKVSGFNLNLVSKSGHFFVTDVEGSISAKTPAGDIKVNNFKGELKAKTKSGEIVVSQLNGNMDVVCENGNSTVKEVKGNLKLLGGNGNMEVEDVEGEISLKSTKWRYQIVYCQRKYCLP